MNTAEVADKLGTTPRNLRRFLRESGKGVGSGKRYNIQSFAQLKKQYLKWGK